MDIKDFGVYPNVYKLIGNFETVNWSMTAEYIVLLLHVPDISHGFLYVAFVFGLLLRVQHGVHFFG